MFISILELSLDPPHDCLPENRQLYESLSPCLIPLPCSIASSTATSAAAEAILKPFAERLKTWRTLLVKYLRNQDDQIELLQTFEEYCLGDGVFAAASPPAPIKKRTKKSRSKDKARNRKKSRSKLKSTPEVDDSEKEESKKLGESALHPVTSGPAGAVLMSCPYAPLFMKVLMLSYKFDILSEEAILQWAEERTHATGDDRRFMEQSKEFIEWLQTASEEESSDED